MLRQLLFQGDFSDPLASYFTPWGHPKGPGLHEVQDINQKAIDGHGRM